VPEEQEPQGTGAPGNGQEPGATANELAKLRRENATWRRKYREAEVSIELVRRGVQAEPSWVKVAEDEEVAAAVERFVLQYPNLAPGGQVEEYEEPAPRPTAPAALPTSPRKANTPGPPPKGALVNRNLEEIKKDPVARQRLREEYRELLKNSSNQVETF
jgi:hypothetical protein